MFTQALDVNMNNLVSDNVDPGKPDQIDTNAMQRGPATMRSTTMANGMTLNALNEHGNDPNKQRMGTMNRDLFEMMGMTVGQDQEDVSVIIGKMAPEAGAGGMNEMMGEDQEDSGDDEMEGLLA
jgi:hypothetical protein